MEPPNNEILQGMSPEQQKYIESLQQSLKETEARKKRFEEGWSNLFDQNRALREEHQKLQQGYETLRIQKGGFGFKMLMLSGWGGFFTALVLCFVYLKLKPKDPHTIALQNFRNEHLMEYELSLSKNEFDAVRLSLEESYNHPENKPIRTDIEIIRELVEAAQKGCEKQH